MNNCAMCTVRPAEFRMTWPSGHQADWCWACAEGFDPFVSRVRLCVNGCQAPVCPPSKVICRVCLDKIGATLLQLCQDTERKDKDAKGS